MKKSKTLALIRNAVWPLTLFSVLFVLDPGRSEAEEPSFEFSVQCGWAPCTEAVELTIYHRLSSEKLCDITIQPGRIGQIPIAVGMAVKNGEYTFDDAVLTAKSDSFVSNHVSLIDLYRLGFEERVFRLWPASEVIARFQPKGENHNPSAVSALATLLLWPADATGGFQPTFRTECPVVGGDWNCRVPIGNWDLRLDLSGFVSVHKWSENFSAPTVRDLGEISIDTGSDVAGVLEVRASRIPDLSRSSEVEAFPSEVVGYSDSKEKKRRLRALTHTTIPHQNGTFVFQDLAVGSYLVKAEVWGIGESDYRKFSITLPTAYDLSQPLIVFQRVDVVLRTGLALDQYGDPLRADLFSLEVNTSETSPPRKLSLDPSGLTPIPSLVVGSYLLSIHSDDGTTYFQGPVTIENDSRFLDIPLQEISVYGRAVINEEPMIGARLDFSGLNGQAISTNTDENGDFSLVLPVEGAWFVTAKFENPRTLKGFQEVNVVQGSPLLIEFGLAGISGTVRDPTRLPQPNVNVVVIGAGPYKTNLATDEEGVFEVLGLAPGDYLIQASSNGLESSLRIVEVGEVDFVEIELILNSSRSFVRGKLVDRDGRPVAHASGSAFSRDMHGNPVSIVGFPFNSDGNGEFIISLPTEADFFHIAVAAEGYDLYVSGEHPTAVGMEGEITFALDSPSGGTLDVELPQGTRWSRSRLIQIDEKTLPFSFVDKRPSTLHRSMTDDGRIIVVVSDMPAGAYRLCQADHVDYLRVLSGSHIVGLDCVEGFLAPGGKLRLEGMD